jgi:tetratricopeptide (TPR) repeat protein
VRHQIEKAVRERRTQRARKLITDFVRGQRKSLASRLEACDWLRRLGLYRDGFLLIRPARWSLREVSAATLEGEQLLWAARFLNLTGATSHALMIAQRLQPESAADHRVIANIFLSADEAAKALVHFRAAERLQKNPNDYSARLAQVGLADALALTGDVDRALRKVRSVRAAPDEKLLRGILLQAEGEYLARDGRFSEARKIFERAISDYPEAETPDHGILYKWYAFVLARTGRNALARRYFDRAFRILSAPSIKSEAWLEVLYLKNEAGLARPDEVEALHLYPRSNPAREPRTLRWTRPNSAKPTWKISLPRQEYQHGSQRKFSLPLEVRLLGLLRLAGPYGISQVTLAALLWPDEPGSFAELETRLFQLLNRLRRKHRITWSVREGVVRLSVGMIARIVVETGAGPAPLLFFERQKRFTASEFARFYGSSRSRAAVRLNEALNLGWIRRGTASGRKPAYFSEPYRSTE